MTMLRFVDVSEPYWCDEINAKARPCCIFIDTVTDRCAELAGTRVHVFDSLNEVRMALGERGVGLVPDGFFGR